MIAALMDCFSALKDPRQQTKVLYPLSELLLLLLAATLAGADDFVEVCLWGREHLDFLRRLLPYKAGIPSHDTLTDLVAALDTAHFRACFTTWVEGLRDDYTTGEHPEVVAIDGKTSRRTHNHRRGREPLHLLSAWASSQRLVVGQLATAGKANEASTIPRLLEHLHLRGALVTIDAAGATTRIAQAILAREADYLLAIKANRPALLAATEQLFADPHLDWPQSTTEEVSHGRQERRRHVVCHQVDWLNPTRWESDSVRFPQAAMVGMVESTVSRDGSTSTERRYYVCSTRLDPDIFGRAVRSHWGIENQLHWTLDVVFHDDLTRLRTGNAPENMAIIKHMAANMIRKAAPSTSFKNRRKLAGWNTDYLHHLIRGIA